MMEELSRHGFQLGPGTLYPALHELEKGGLRECGQKVVEGKVRKYYHKTEAGGQTLDAATRQAMVAPQLDSFAKLLAYLSSPVLF